MKKYLTIAAMGIAAVMVTKPAFAESSGLKELGVTLGTPAGLNINVGWWGDESFPLLARLSGMYYGSLSKGVQGEVGWAFDTDGAFKQFVAAAGLTASIGNNPVTWTGAGPVYGINWHGLSAELGITFGSGTDSNGAKLSGAQAIAQVGYSFLF